MNKYPEEKALNLFFPQDTTQSLPTCPFRRDTEYISVLPGVISTAQFIEGKIRRDLSRLAHTHSVKKQ